MQFAIVLLLLLQADPPPARLVKPMHYRQHFVVRSGEAVLFELTAIHDLTEEKFENVILVRDPEHGDVLLRQVHDFAANASTRRISDVKERTFVEAVLPGAPFAAKTFSETIREAREHHQLFALTPSRVTIRTNGGEWTDIDTQHTDPQTLRALRHRIRPTIDFFLLEAIERMRTSLFQTTHGDPYRDLLATYVLYDSTAPAATPVKAVMQPPNCDFDKSFGYPCTAEQWKKVRAAAEAGKELMAY